jgi:hypothetical protein
VEVVGQQAKAQHGEGHFDAGVSERFEEGVVVTLLVEDLAAAIAPVNDMVADAARRGSWYTWHEPTVASWSSMVKNNRHLINVPVPFSFLSLSGKLVKKNRVIINVPVTFSLCPVNQIQTILPRPTIAIIPSDLQQRLGGEWLRR